MGNPHFSARPEDVVRLAYQVGAWCRKFPSPENKAQVMGVVEAVETLVKKGSDGGGSKQGEFKF